MPKRGGKSSGKKNQQRRNRSNKSQSKSHNKKSKQNAAKIGSNKPISGTKREGQAFTKQILSILNQLTSVLKEVDTLKGSPLYETAIKLDELCDQIINLQSGTSTNKKDNPIHPMKQHKIWGFEDTLDIEPQVLLNRLALWIKDKQKDSYMGDKFEFKADLPEGRGVIATKDLHQGEHTMSIHRKLMMTHGYAMNKSDEKIRRFLKKDALCQFSYSPIQYQIIIIRPIIHA